MKVKILYENPEKGTTITEQIVEIPDDIVSEAVANGESEKSFILNYLYLKGFKATLSGGPIFQIIK